jgi:hypothetical protein
MTGMSLMHEDRLTAWAQPFQITKFEHGTMNAEGRIRGVGNPFIVHRSTFVFDIRYY